ncbi:MAG: hypothetical protein IPM29_23845 [Planctomycetes bacterium]|nr:hypothetical protein [Planctomycetota bacterium]
MWYTLGDELRALVEFAEASEGAHAAHARGELPDVAGGGTLRMQAWRRMLLPEHPDVVPRLLDLLPDALSAAHDAATVEGRETATVDHCRFAGAWLGEVMSALGGLRDRSIAAALLPIVTAVQCSSAIRVDVAKALLRLDSPDCVRAAIRLRRTRESAGTSQARDVSWIDRPLRETFALRAIEMPAPPRANAAAWFRLLGRGLRRFRAL